jgi:hypothetical protein
MSRRLLIAIAVLGSACGRSPFTPAEDVVASASEESMKLTALALPLALVSGPARAGQPGVEQCQMHIEQEGDLFHAVYDTPELCGSDRPRWVAIDLWVEYVQMETMDYPHGRRVDCDDPSICNAGWYMRPVNFEAWQPSVAGAAYAIQARSVEGGGRATVYITWNRKGALAVTK